MKLTNAIALPAALFLLLTSLLPVFAESKPVRYQVEVIIFEQLTLKSWYEELWPVDVALEKYSRIVNLKPHDGKQSNWSMLSIAEAPKTRTLWRKIENSKGYRVIGSRAWIQPVTSSKQSKYVKMDIQSTASKARIEGAVRLYKNRFFHLDVDLVLSRTIPLVTRNKFAEFINIPVDDLQEQWQFRLNQSRKIKTKELQYFDHPIFGVLIRVIKK